MPVAPWEISRTMHGKMEMQTERKEEQIRKSCRSVAARACTFDG